MKNIVLCSDGTGNSGGKGRGTNVWRIFNSVDLNGHKWDRSLAPQVAFHDDGVGTQSNVVLKVLGGALGLGLKRNIRQLYTFLVRNYEPGDRIFLFGFSRGAYTVRALGGLITRVGIIDRRRYDDEALESLVKQAVVILRRHFQRNVVKQFSGAQAKERRRAAIEADADRFRTEHCVQHETLAPGGLVNIAFIGVWDTVDAYGFPFDHLADFWHYAVYPFRFPDTRISQRVEHASHAVSIDDERHTFHPVMWDENDDTVGRLNQVWFPGVHSNVGGGYPKDGLALVTLDWMMSEAERSGLRFLAGDRAHVRNSANAYDKLYNSRSGLAVFYRYRPRDVGRISNDHGIKTPKIHYSTFRRITSSVEGYGPGNLPVRFEVVGTEHNEPAIDEGRQQLARISENVISRSEAPLLDKVASQVLFRRFLHYIFLAITVSVLAMSWMFRKDGQGVTVSPGEPGLAGAAQLVVGLPGWLFDFVVAPFIAQPCQTIPPVLGSLIVIWMLGASTRDTMQRTFTAFWRKVFSDDG